jgi:hypothetical protein
MATTFQVDKALREFTDALDDGQDWMTREKARVVDLRARVSNLPTSYSAEMTEIDGYTPTGAFETLAKDMKTKLATARTKLLADMDAVIAEYTAQGF